MQYKYDIFHSLVNKCLLKMINYKLNIASNKLVNKESSF